MDAQALTAFRQVGVGTMHLARTLGKRARHDGRAADVLEGAAPNRAVFRIVNEVESGTAQLAERTVAEFNLLGMADADGTHGSLYPCLVLQSFVPRQAFMLLQLIGIDQREAALQSDVAFMQGTGPAGMFEGHVSDIDMTGPVDDKELLNAVALLGSPQQKAAVALLSAYDGLWPRMLELQTALRLMEGYDSGITVHDHIFYTQNGDGPTLMDEHFKR